MFDTNLILLIVNILSVLFGLVNLCMFFLYKTMPAFQLFISLICTSVSMAIIIKLIIKISNLSTIGI